MKGGRGISASSSESCRVVENAPGGLGSIKGGVCRGLARFRKETLHHRMLSNSRVMTGRNTAGAMRGESVNEIDTRLITTILVEGGRGKRRWTKRGNSRSDRSNIARGGKAQEDRKTSRQCPVWGRCI